MSVSEEMANRARRCVCKYCGEAVTPAIIVYNRYGGSGVELYCGNCRKTENGVEKEIYDWAYQFVIHSGFDYFLDMEDEKERLQHNVAKVCELITWSMSKTGLLTKDGLRKGAKAQF